MIKRNNQLEIRSVSELNGRFRIPSYQRGYRWERRQVEQLLDDLLEHSKSSDKTKPYYLQPIVVAPASPQEIKALAEDEKFDFDLIDGQQRLTTIQLIIRALEAVKSITGAEMQRLMNEDQDKALARFSLAGNLKDVHTGLGYELMYQTRKESRDFIREITNINRGDHQVTLTPDHLYMWHAFNSINKWIECHMADVKGVADTINDNVRIIWYELSESVPNWKKFKDLNDGKIALTNSELIKALVLKRSSKYELPDYEQDVIVSQWDEIEQELSDEKFWRFLTKKPMSDYPTKIDLLFDLIAGKSADDKKDEFFTFRFFSDLFESKKKEGKNNKDNWTYIHDRYRRIRDWYLDTWTYHRIGYLVAVGGDKTLRDIYLDTYPETCMPLTHKQLREKIETRIIDTMKLEVNSFKDLTYGNHNQQIIRVLTLYNVMIADELQDTGVRYPFHRHNAGDLGGWSLEHVHAQNSEDLKGLIEWKTWVKEQMYSLQRLEPQLQANGINYTKTRYDNLIAKMQTFLSGNRSDERQYKDIVTEFSELSSISAGNSSKYDMHSIANLALLSRDDNSMLNKSSFDVKRMKIALKSSTNFVPIGTERVFMKAIVGCTKDADGNCISDTEYACDTSQMFFWGDTDRDAYIRDIEEKLNKYLPKAITVESQTNDPAKQ